jgi:hypothetical protein
MKTVDELAREVIDLLNSEPDGTGILVFENGEIRVIPPEHARDPEAATLEPHAIERFIAGQDAGEDEEQVCRRNETGQANHHHAAGATGVHPARPTRRANTGG